MSPSGAHRWVVRAPGQTMREECKYCHAKRTFSPFEESVEFTNSRGRAWRVSVECTRIVICP